MSFKVSMFKLASPQHMLQQTLRQVLWLIFAISLLTFSLGLSWQLNKSENFFYSFWYQHLQIDMTIKKYVVNNMHGKRDFPVADTNLHQQKFADIVQAIHQQGHGLADISYENAQAISQKLLTKSEVEHLQDVANLLDSISKLWWGNLVLLLSLLIFYCRKHKHLNILNNNKVATSFVRTMPTGKQKLISLACFVLLLGVILGLWGFTSVFYYLHTVIFPVDHQWFFYYQDSLMATIMKAPDIFAAIAAQLVVIALPIVWGVDAMTAYFQRKLNLTEL
jgi:uncharacterized membrane protein